MAKKELNGVEMKRDHPPNCRDSAKGTTDEAARDRERNENDEAHRESRWTQAREEEMRAKGKGKQRQNGRDHGAVKGRARDLASSRTSPHERR